MSGRYIVVFKDSASQDKIDNFARHVDNTGGQVIHRYDAVLKGLAATLTESHISSFQDHEIIEYIEPDAVVTTQTK